MPGEAISNYYDPYSELSRRSRLFSAILEIPSGAISILSRYSKVEKINVEQIEEVMEASVKYLIANDQLDQQVTYKSSLGRGYETQVFSFLWNDEDWVMKVGLKKGFAHGFIKQSSEEYALALRSGYLALAETFNQRLPFLLPQPVHVLPPGSVGNDTTIQIMPLIRRIKKLETLELNSIQSLIIERLKFYLLAKGMRKEGLIIDMLGPGNLIVGDFETKAHLSLVDVGLFYKSAPIPLIIASEKYAQELALIYDVSKLKRVAKKKQSSA